MNFGKRLRELRKARGLTQSELAQKTSISFTYVSKLETGTIPAPRQHNILSLAKALDLNKAETDELFGLARKIPSDLLYHIDIQTIDMLRSLKDGEQTPAQEVAALRRRIIELEASLSENAQLTELPEKHGASICLYDDKSWHLPQRELLL